ncbi:MAG: hypothetical protein Q9224_005976, partial [Gallowayella concinna]
SLSYYTYPLRFSAGRTRLPPIAHNHGRKSTIPSTHSTPSTPNCGPNDAQLRLSGIWDLVTAIPADAPFVLTSKMVTHPG